VKSKKRFIKNTEDCMNDTMLTEITSTHVSNRLSTATLPSEAFSSLVASKEQEQRSTLFKTKQGQCRAPNLAKKLLSASRPQCFLASYGLQKN